MTKCPQNHESETADFCSVCGAEMSAAARAEPIAPSVVPARGPAPAPNPVAVAPICPDCGTPSESAAQVYCEVCGHNFQTGASGIPPAAPSTGAAAPSASTSQSPSPAATAVRWDLTVEVDPMLYGTSNAEAPLGQSRQILTLYLAENLVGRLTPGIRAHVPVHNDPGVSRRHALLLLQPDGGLSVRDLGSANGTQLRGADLLPGMDTPMKDGDSISLGAWTRITVRAVNSARKASP